MVMKKSKVISVCIMIILAIIVIYFFLPIPLVKKEIWTETVQIFSIDEQLNEKDITDRITAKAVKEILKKYKTQRIMYEFAPYQRHEGDLEINFQDVDGEIYHIYLYADHKLNVMYHSGSWGHPILNAEKFYQELRGKVSDTL
ncbi:MAG: hypothetical protein PHE06_02055 [Lachnospiraceae bacterium]|nr:hypothetical protein [Lachnospiraceae bacterium]